MAGGPKSKISHPVGMAATRERFMNSPASPCEDV
jgi:hypothetical protein